MMLLAVTLALTAWRGPSLPTAAPGAAKYRLSVRGSANELVSLRAQGVPGGWIASFCTPTFCAPLQYVLHLDRAGKGALEFQVIRISESAPHGANVRITAPGARSLSLTVRG